MTTGGTDKLFEFLEAEASRGEFSVTRKLWKKELRQLQDNGLSVKFISDTPRKGEALYLICWDNGEVPMDDYNEKNKTLKAVNRLWAMAYNFHKQKGF